MIFLQVYIRLLFLEHNQYIFIQQVYIQTITHLSNKLVLLLINMNMDDHKVHNMLVHKIQNYIRGQYDLMELLSMVVCMLKRRTFVE